MVRAPGLRRLHRPRRQTKEWIQYAKTMQQFNSCLCRFSSNSHNRPAGLTQVAGAGAGRLLQQWAVHNFVVGKPAEIIGKLSGVEEMIKSKQRKTIDSIGSLYKPQ